MGSKLPKHREQRQMESFSRILLGEIRREIIVVVQSKTKGCITAENKRPFFKRNCRIMQNTSKVEKFNLSGALLFGLINDAKDFLLHQLLVIARHYIYSCKQRDTRPNVHKNSCSPGPILISCAFILWRPNKFFSALNNESLGLPFQMGHLGYSSGISR